MVASDISELINPTVANGIVASFTAFFSIGVLLAPFQFVRGTKWPKQEPWFRGLSENPNSCMYTLMQFCAVTQICWIVIPTLVEPHSQMLTYFFTINMFLQLVHQALFLGGVGIYKECVPNTMAGKMQWVSGTVIGVVALVVCVIACLHEGGPIPYVAYYYQAGTGSHVLPIFIVNIILAAFGAINALQFIFMPTHFVSTWFGAAKSDLPSTARTADGGTAPTKKFMGFDVMPENGALTFWARQEGLLMLSLVVTCAVHPVDGVTLVFYHPLFTFQCLCFFPVIAAINIHALQLQHVEGTTKKHYLMTWLPQIIFCIGFAILALLAMVRLPADVDPIYEAPAIQDVISLSAPAL